VSKPASRVEAALYELCVNYGYCIGADARNEIIAIFPKIPTRFSTPFSVLKAVNDQS
jgi:hypothetical protein